MRITNIIDKTVTNRVYKKNKNFSWVDFNILIESVALTDKIGHLFVVDIFFDTKNANEKQLLYNEIFPPVIEKQKILEAYKRSAYQLLELFDKTKQKPKSYRCTPKSHANLFPKTFILLYLEDLRFLIKRCGWKVKKFTATLHLNNPVLNKNLS